VSEEIQVETRLQWGSKPVGYKWEDVARLAKILLIYYMSLNIIHYVDDFTNVIPPDENNNFDTSMIPIHITAIQIIMDSLSMKVGKWQYGSLIEVLGITFNTCLSTISIPERRLRGMIDLANNIIRSKSARARTIASLLGKLISVSFIFPFVKRELPTLTKLITHRVRAGGWDAWIRLSTDTKQTITLFITQLTKTKTGPTVRLINRKHSTTHVVYVDACRVGVGITTPITRELGTIMLDDDMKRHYMIEKELSIPALEAYSFLIALTDFIHNFQTYTKSLLVLTDSRTVIDTLSRGWSKHKLLHNICTTILLLAREADIDLNVEWVESERNLADYSSRFSPHPSLKLIPRVGFPKGKMQLMYGDVSAWRHRCLSLSPWEAHSQVQAGARPAPE
jgi:hypothetical protein